MTPKYFNYDNKVPFEKKMLVCHSLDKVPQSVLERMVMDVRRNKPTQLKEAK